MGQQMIDESQVDLSNIKNTLQNKADLVNGKVPAEQLPPASQGGADITLSNVKSIDSSSAVAVELGKKADKTYVDGRLADKADLVDGKVPADQLPDIPSGGADITLSNVKSIDPSSAVAVEFGKKADETYVDGELATKADLVDGKVPVSQLPDMPSDGADKTLSNVTDIAPTSKVQVELDKKVNKSGDTMTGPLVIPEGVSINFTDSTGKTCKISKNNKNLSVLCEEKGVYLDSNLENLPGYTDGKQGYPVLVGGKTVKDYIIESFSDVNGNWYEVYSSGKIRQGGIFDNGSSVKTASVTINFLKPFANTNYTVVGNPSRGAVVNTSTSMALGIHSKTQSNFAFTFLGCGNTDTVQYVEWMAEGQGA